ncbi:MAG: glutaminyl-peptide cyclotransferase [Vicinamibacterales bacterium]
MGRLIATSTAAASLVAACAGAPSPAAVTGPAVAAGYRVVKSYPHDPDAFTQGLVFADGKLLESTGLNGRSSLRRVELETGRVVQQRPVDSAYFAEGLAAWKDSLIQLTWQSGVAFVYDRSSFALQRTVTYSGEGWGLTHDGQHLFLSDGSSSLRVLDPESFAELRRIAVTDRGAPVADLNELEFVKGEIWANVWQSDRIARISPDTGQVVGWIDLAGLRPTAVPPGSNAVLNGIAYDPEGDRLFVTGKFWPAVFQIEIVAPQGARPRP